MFLCLKSLVGMAHLPLPIVEVDGVVIFALIRSWSVGIGGVDIFHSLHPPKKSSLIYILSILDWFPSEFLDQR